MPCRTRAIVAASNGHMCIRNFCSQSEPITETTGKQATMCFPASLIVYTMFYESPEQDIIALCTSSSTCPCSRRLCQHAVAVILSQQKPARPRVAICFHVTQWYVFHSSPTIRVHNSLKWPRCSLVRAQFLSQSLAQSPV